MSFKPILVSLLTIVLVYEPAFAAAPVLGQVIVKGQAKINGTVTPSSATVFLGDRVATETDTVAEVLLNGGSRVVLPAASDVVLNNDAKQIIVNLKQGALAVLSATSSPVVIDASGTRIRAAADTGAVFEVAIRENSLKVSARRGSAIVETADKSLEVPEGKELDATMAPDPPQGSPGTRAAAKGRLETIVFITAVGAGITGLVLGLIAINRPNPTDCQVVSPSGPESIICP
jgi:FecR-like protein